MGGSPIQQSAKWNLNQTIRDAALRPPLRESLLVNFQHYVINRYTAEC